MKGTKNSMANIEQELNNQSSENISRSRKSKKYHSRDERVDNERENYSHAENFTQDIIEFSQSFSVVPKKRNRLDNCNSEICIVSSGEPRFKKLSMNSPESCVELEKKSSGNYPNERVKKKDRKKLRIPSIVDSESHSNVDYDIIVDEELNYQTQVESNDTNHDEERKKSKSKLKHRSSWDMSFPDFLSTIEIQCTDDAETKSEMLKKDRKRKRNGKVEKKIANTTPIMIPDSASSSENETQETYDCAIATLNNGNTRENNKFRVGQILSTRVEEEEGHSSNTKHFRKFIPILNSNKTSDSDRSKGLENDRDCCQDQKGSEFVKTIRSEKWPAERGSKCSSRNISVEDLKIEPDVIRKDKKHKSKENGEKKEPNTFLAMIHDIRSSSDSDDEIKMIDDCSVETPNEGNTREYNKSRVSHTLSTSDKGEESHSSKTKGVKRLVTSSTSNKASDNYRLKSQESDEELFQDESHGFESVRVMKSEKLPANTASDHNLANISVEHVKIEPDVIRKNKKHKSKEKVKKKKANTLLAMIHDIKSSSDSDDEIKMIDDCFVETPNEGNTREYNKSRVSHTLSTSDKDEESHSSQTKGVKNLVSSSTSNKASDNYRLESQESDEELFQDESQGFEFVRVTKSEKLSADTASDHNLPNISVEHVKTEPDVIRKNKKHKSKEKVKKKKANTLPAMIRDTSISSDSDIEIKKIDDCSVETLNKGITRKRNKFRISQTLSTSFKEEESHSPNTKHFRKFIPIPNSDKTSDIDRSKGLENYRDYCQDHQQGFEFVRAIRSEKLPADIASNCSSTNISVDDLKLKPDVIREDRKHEAEEKVEKKKTNTLLGMIHDIRSSSDSDDEIKMIDDCSVETLNEGNTREYNKSRASYTLSTSDKDEESHSSKTKGVKKLITSSTSNKASDNYRLESQESDEELFQDESQGFEFEPVTKSEKLSADTASDHNLPNISVEHVKTEPDVIRKNKKHKSKEKFKKKKANGLLGMIHDIRSSSDSDDEIKMIDDCSVKTSNKEFTRKRNKFRVSQILSTRVEEEESHPLDIKHFSKFIPIPNSDKTSDKDRSKDQENDEDSSQDNQQSIELVKAITSEILPVEDLKIKSDVIRKDRKQFEKKDASTILAKIGDTSISSDLDDEIDKIDDSFEESVDKLNSRKSTTSRVSETFKKEEEDEGSSEQPVESPSAINREFDLEAETEDIEELISAVGEREQIPHETVTRLLGLRVRLKHTVPPQHLIQTYAGSRGPTPSQKKMIEKFGPIKYGKFAPGEDDIIVNNWNSFCELHDWDPSDVKPFLYMRHEKVGLIAKFSERLKFVQFLADGLPWRTLYSVYWRFRNLYQPRIHTKYTEDEDRLILAYLENSSDKKNVRKYSELGKILNRKRDSVWKRYHLLIKRRIPYKSLEWNLHLVKKIIKNLIKLTLSNDVSQLKYLDIPLVVWKKLSDKLKIDNNKLKRFWHRKLHMQLFCQEPVYLNDAKIKLIEYFHTTGISESWEIEWPSVAKNFNGMTTVFLSQIFRGLVRPEKYEGMNLGEIIQHLYEVKKPQIQKTYKDKCLPRIVFKDGNVELIDVNADTNISKQEIVKSEDLSD